MKKIYSILIILSVCVIISCNDSSSSNLPNEYTNPFTSPPAEPSSYKSFNNIGGGGFPDESGQSCKAVIYQGTLNGTPQVGFAIEDNSGHKLKIYWDGSIDTSSTNNIYKLSNEYTIKVLSGGTEHTTTSAPLDISIEPHTNPAAVGIFTITFNSPILVGGVTINSAAIINAYKY
ncbi:MAG: hypothetical protein FWH53_02965 [Leptospirales bacterium]|nr:hypothetical protein [Leptospirales bacterium]